MTATDLHLHPICVPCDVPPPRSFLGYVLSSVDIVKRRQRVNGNLYAHVSDASNAHTGGLGRNIEEEQKDDEEEEEKICSDYWGQYVPCDKAFPYSRFMVLGPFPSLPTRTSTE